MKTTRYLLIIATILLVCFKCYYLSRQQFNIDVLTHQLQPVTKYIKPRSIISLYNNYNYSDIFMSTEYILAPAIVVQRPDADTLLLIQSKSMGPKVFTGYHNIIQVYDGDRIIALIARAK